MRKIKPIHNIKNYIYSVVVLKKVLVLEDPQGPIYKSLSLSLDHKVLENCQGLRILQTVVM